MDTIFMNSKNCKTPEPCRLFLNLADKMDFRRGDKHVALSNFSIYYTWKNIKNSYNNNKFKVLSPTWNKEFELPDKSYSVSDTQYYFKYNIKNMNRENREKQRICEKIEKMCFSQKLLKQFQFVVILSTIIVSKNQESFIHLFPITLLVSYWIFHLKL